MANAQNTDTIFAELAKKVQREVRINLPRKVGMIAKNHSPITSAKAASQIQASNLGMQP